MSFKKTFFKSISSFAIYNYIIQALEFISTIVLSRLLLPEEYGFVAIIAVFSGFIQLFANVGIGQSVIRSDYGYTFHRHLYSLSVWMGFALTGILMLLAWPIAEFFDNKALFLPTVLISFKFIFDSFTYIPYAILSKNLQFTTIGRTRLVSSIFQIGLTILMAWLGFSYWSLIIPLIISPVIQFFYLRANVDIRFNLFGWRATRRIFVKIRSLMGHLSLNNLIGYWAGNADKLIVGKFYTQADLGLYNRAFRFIQFTHKLIASIFGTVLFPALKKLIEDGGDVHKEYLDILRFIILFNMPVAFILIIFPNELVYFLWGSSWMGVAEFLPFIGILLINQAILGTMPGVFILYGKERNLLIISTANTLFSLVFVIIGSLFSILHMLIFVTAGMVWVTIPLQMYFGFYKTFGCRTKLLIRFALPFLAFCSGLLLSILLLSNWYIIMLFSLYLGLILYELKHSVYGIFLFILSALGKRKNEVK